MYENKLLTEELIGLERNNNGKIDHSPLGINSKDSADALCGALFNASQHAEEFAFDYGESLSETITFNKATSDHQQLALDFEQEMLAILDPHKNDPAIKQSSKTSGFGANTSTPSYIYDNMIIWWEEIKWIEKIF